MTEQDELHAVVAARRELGPEYEPELIDSFLERVERRVEKRHGKAARRSHEADMPLVLGSLGLAIPLLAIAGAAAGVVGVALVCVAIVLVNVLALRR